MKRTDPTKLTEATLLRAVLERSGKPVAYKTLAELDALGRPPRPAVETLCESLIERGYLVPAVAAKGNGVQATAKEHPALWALLISEHLAGVDAARTADAADALDEVMTEEMETDLKTQHELQEQVEVIGAGQEALAAQVAALIKQNGDGAAQP